MFNGDNVTKLNTVSKCTVFKFPKRASRVTHFMLVYFQVIESGSLVSGFEMN